jgi:hypothetical protein
MEGDKSKAPQPELTPDGDVFGAPRKFDYPKPPPYLEGEREYYEAAGKRIDEIMAKLKQRRRRR